MTYKSMAKLNRFMRYPGQKLKRTRKVRQFSINPSNEPLNIPYLYVKCGNPEQISKEENMR